jgi:hypothetical protein
VLESVETLYPTKLSSSDALSDKRKKFVDGGDSN